VTSGFVLDMDLCPQVIAERVSHPCHVSAVNVTPALCSSYGTGECLFVLVCTYTAQRGLPSQAKCYV
jgi:hypothetical protein